jgi:hypothetical protein
MADGTPDEDFLDGSAAADPAYADAPAAPAAPARRRLPSSVVTAAWLVVGLVVGVIGVAVWHSSANATGTPTAATNQQVPPGAQQAPPGAFGRGGFGGGRDGEQHVFGTLAAVGSTTITVRTDSGTATTYRTDSSTQLVKDGQQVSSLSAMHVGDQVVVHVYPLNGSMHVERVLDGAPPGGFGGFGGTTTTT